MKGSIYKFACLSLAAPLLAFAQVKSSAPTRYQASTKQEAETPSEQMTMITPSVSPVVDHGYNVFITADFIYWTARVNNLDYAQTGVGLLKNASQFNGTSNSNAIATQGRQYHANHKMSPGFKVGIGCDLHHDGWDTYFHYTWLRNKASSNETLGTNAISLWHYAPITNFSTFTTTAGHANTSWRLHFNVLDWELGRDFYISPRLLLRPHFGLKGSWQTQHNDVAFTNLTDTVGSTITTGHYTITQKQSYWGLGVRSGLNTAWKFDRNWSIFGDVALAALWSQFKNSRTDTATQAATTSFTNLQVTNLRSQTHTVAPVLEWDLGLRWDYWFCDDDYRIRIQAGWEEQVWFDQNYFTALGATNRTGALTLQGLTLDFRFDF